MLRSEPTMSPKWKWVWAGLFLGALPAAFMLVAIGELWNGVGVLILAMVAFARFAYLYNREQADEG